ncbi:MAG: glycosyltransferase [Verrucomicrobiota bacterium]
MKVIHISSADIQGGANRAAYRLHRALLEAGIKSRMLVRTKGSQDAEISVASLEEEAVLAAQARLVQKYFIDSNRASPAGSYFSIPLPGFDLAQDARVQDSDIIHLHWITGLLSPRSIARLQQSGKPVFWTLHDQRAFTGGCHYSAGCGRFQTTCETCPQLARDDWGIARAGLEESRQAMDSRLLTVICPSRWMAEAAIRSDLLSRARVEVIPNCIDTRLFMPGGKREARLELGLAPDKTCFLFGAENCAEQRKGFVDLAQTLRLLPLSDAIQFASFGRTADTFDRLPLKVKSFGHISSDRRLAVLYTAADAFLLPSTEDNLPNTMLEAMACGTPVIGFAIGGLPDVVTPETGILVPSGDCRGLADAIRYFKPDARRAARARAMAENYSPDVISRRHIELYAQFQSVPRACPTSSNRLPCLPPGPAFAAVFEPLLQQARQRRRGRWWRRLAGRS